jgi:hypothetical protein
MASAEPTTKLQHYVWQHYLNAWAANGTFCCYRQKDKKLFPTQPKAVASETYFYETEQLTAGDIKFLENFISKATDERLRELNLDYVEMTQRTFVLRDNLKRTNVISDRIAMEHELRWIEKNLVERYHSGIESRCLDILDSLRSADNAFYEDALRCSDFLYFLSLQYFRTAKMRKGVSDVPSYVHDHDPRRTANILNHIHATNVGAALFRERSAYRIVFLKNGNSVPFIAGDQPILNMLDPQATDDLALFYPLSPGLAMMLTKDAKAFPDRERSVTSLEVERYNYAIYSTSEDQIYSNDPTYLRGLVEIGKDVLGP